MKGLKPGNVPLERALSKLGIASRTQARSGLKAQLRERIAQLQEEIDGVRIQSAAQEDAIALMREELDGLEQLYAQKIVARTRIMELRREESTMRGTLAVSASDHAHFATAGDALPETAAKRAAKRKRRSAGRSAVRHWRC